MILPTHDLPPEQSLIVIGGEVLALLRDGPASVSSLWVGMRDKPGRPEPLGFDRFSLAPDLPVYHWRDKHGVRQYSSCQQRGQIVYIAATCEITAVRLRHRVL